MTEIQQLSYMGKYHAHTNGENQDAVLHGENDKYSVITLADGVSSCKQAKEGAGIAGRAITKLLLNKGQFFMKYDEFKVAKLALSNILYEIKKYAKLSKDDITDYSSTVACVLVDKLNDRMMCINLGDSLIMATGLGDYKVVAMPCDSTDGCYVTTTAGAEEEIYVRKIIDIGGMENIIILSDGAWRQMFNKNRLHPEVETILKNEEFEKLKKYLEKSNSMDDCSFIAMSIKNNAKEKI